MLAFLLQAVLIERRGKTGVMEGSLGAGFDGPEERRTEKVG